MKIIMPIVGAAIALAACSEPAPVGEVAAAPIDVAVETEADAPAPAAIEAAKAALRAEPKIKDFHYDPEAAVQWNVGVLDDGSSRIGYAQYVCHVLSENGAMTEDTHVRVVDVAKVVQGSDFRSANLGHIVCKTGDILDA